MAGRKSRISLAVVFGAVLFLFYHVFSETRGGTYYQHLNLMTTGAVLAVIGAGCLLYLNQTRILSLRHILFLSVSITAIFLIHLVITNPWVIKNTGLVFFVILFILYELAQVAVGITFGWMIHNAPKRYR